ncbi:MAG: hypothetical protein M1444_02125 [Patescibacteria group bacterium]|nr:hypothetical protein [Patescibacteria group bacterium]
MKIGIDISQLAYEETGVANYLENLVQNLVDFDKKNDYVLFFSSLRKDLGFKIKDLRRNQNVTIKQFKIPPTVLEILWNKLHIMPIENFIGEVDVFLTSDWTEPPAKHAKKVTILYDFIVYKYPEETHNQTEFNPLKLVISPNIVASQKRKLQWVKKESDKIICISKSTVEDAKEILGIPQDKLVVAYPGL